MKDANGNVTSMTYDSQNRLTRTTYPDSLYDSAIYDNAGRVVTKTDRNRTVTSSSYDTAGNLVKVASASDTICNSYDSAGEEVSTSNSLGSIDYTYDSHGHVRYLNETIDGTTYSLLFTYDAAGNLKSITYPDAKVVSFDYDAYNCLIYANRTTNSSLNLEFLTYNTDDSVAETYGISLVDTTYTYDTMARPTSFLSGAGHKTATSLAYTYYPDGNVKYLETNDGTDRNQSYCYDQLGRLTRGITNASGSWGTITYGYDAVGNRLWMNATGTNTTYTYAGYNQLNKTTTGSTVWWYNYDRNGNLIWKNGTTQRYQYVFNSLNELTRVINWTKSGSTWSSAVMASYYDANGARARVVVGSTVTDYVYLGQELFFEKTGTVSTDYVYVNGQLKATLTGSNAYYYIDDPIGSVWQVRKYGGKGTIVFSVISYKPFGTPIVGTQTTTEEIMFAGEIQDAPSGLYYIAARWMDPTLGTYIYCDNDPLRDQWNWKRISPLLHVRTSTWSHLWRNTPRLHRMQ